MKKITIALEPVQALEFVSMLVAMEDLRKPAHPIFQGMIMTLRDKIQKSLIDTLTLEEIDALTKS
jgi:hypothetical protein